MAVKKKKVLSFEEGMRALEAVVEQLSGKEIPLEEAITLYEQGKALAADLEKMLSEQKKRIEWIDPDTAEIEVFEENANGIS